MSFVGNERKITVEREKLLEKLRAGLAKHKIAFAEAHDDYVKAAGAFVRAAAERVAVGDLSNLDFSRHCQKPVSFEDDFEAAISMIEMSVEGHITLDERTFKQWVLGKWDWAGQFEAYGMAAKSALSALSTRVAGS